MERPAILRRSVVDADKSRRFLMRLLIINQRTLHEPSLEFNVIAVEGFYVLVDNTPMGLYINRRIRADVLSAVQRRDLWMFTEEEMDELQQLSMMTYAVSMDLFHRDEVIPFTLQRVEYFIDRLYRVLYREQLEVE